MAAKRKGLGKGINNLIPETDVIRSTPKKKTEKKNKQRKKQRRQKKKNQKQKVKRMTYPA